MSTEPTLTSTHVWLTRHRATIADLITKLQGKLDLLDELILECTGSVTVSDHPLDSQPVIIMGPPMRRQRKPTEHPYAPHDRPPPQHNPHNMAPEDMVATRERIPLTRQHDIAFAALEAAGSAGLTAAEFSSNTGIKRGTASSLLSSLKAHGFATHRKPRYFVISPNNAKPTDFAAPMTATPTTDTEAAHQ